MCKPLQPRKKQKSKATEDANTDNEIDVEESAIKISYQSEEISKTISDKSEANI